MASRGRTTRAKRKTRRKTTRRRSTVKTRRSAKRPRMTKKKIVDITSRKKRDTMLTSSNTTGDGSIRSTGVALGGGFVRGDNNFTTFIWSPTARTLNQFSGGSATVVQEAMRTATECYMRGLSEHIRIQTNSPAPWLWRRVCFKTKDARFTQFSPGDTADAAQRYRVANQTANGYQRVFFQVSGSGGSNVTLDTYNNILDVLFKGAQGIDFTDFTLAQVDTRRVDLCYDKTVKLASGNSSGVLREYKRWHPMNKTLVYDDDEQGEVEVSSYFSVKDKRGMGDYMVLDLFSPGVGASASDLLAINTSTTLYWHEK